MAVEQFTFPQSGDADDAEHFAALIGQGNLSSFVETGLNLSYDDTVPEVEISQGKAFIRQSQGVASSSGEDILEINHVVQVPSQTVSLTDSATNHIYIEPNFGTDDNADISAYTSTQSGSVLLIGEIDTSTDDVTARNRSPPIEARQLSLGDNQPINFGDNDDFVWQYDSSTGNLVLETDGGDTVATVGDTSLTVSVDVSLDDNNLNGVNSIDGGGSTIVFDDPINVPDDALDADEVDIGRGLEDDGSGAIQFDEDTEYTFTVSQQFNSGLDTRGDIVDDTTTIWDTSAGHVEQTALENDSLTVTAGDGLIDGGSVSLGDSTTLNVDEDYSFTFSSEIQFSGGLDTRGNIVDDTTTIWNTSGGYIEQSALENNSLTVSAGSGLVDGGSVALGGSTTLNVDEDYDFTFTSAIDFSSGLDTQGDVTDGSQIIWDASAQEIPDSAMGSVDNSTLSNDSITINANDGIKSGGTVALGSSIGLDVEPDDFAGVFLSDDGSDNLTVDIGEGLEDDGSEQIRVDEDYDFTFTAQVDFTSGFSSTSTIDMNSNAVTNLPSPSSNHHAARKEYVDSVAQSLTVKSSVDAATDGSNIDLASATDPNPVDGYTLNDGESVLLKDQTDATENGIYVATTATDPTTWTRREDMDADSDAISGAFTFVENGNNNSSSSWIVTTGDPITLGSTDISWAQFAAAGEITAGDGLDRSGQTLDINIGDFVGTGLENDGSDNIRVDEDYDFTFTSAVDFSLGFDIQGDITDGSQIIWDESAQEIPDSALGAIDNATLTNNSITVTAGSGLTDGGSASLGGSTTLNIDESFLDSNYLSLDGTNTMSGTLDLNSNDLVGASGVVLPVGTDMYVST